MHRSIRNASCAAMFAFGMLFGVSRAATAGDSSEYSPSERPEAGDLCDSKAAPLSLGAVQRLLR